MQQAVAEIERETTGDVQQHLTFMLGGEIYGIDILHIKEILEYGDITQVPMMPEFIAGVINLRGSVVPVVDLSLRFSGESVKSTKRTSIVILEVQNEGISLEIGITVDQVNEVLDIPVDEIEPAPSFGTQIRTKFISGMAKVEEKLLVLLDIDNVLSIEELSIVEDVRSSA